jgi:hypothetical protein
MMPIRVNRLILMGVWRVAREPIRSQPICEKRARATGAILWLGIGNGK